jgi:pyruvate/2-oxoglutarate dehydrogenase complex dihydrolipoamide acyltransferase (E2) component
VTDEERWFHMAKKWIALNLLLLIAAVGLARELYQQYEQFKTKTDSARIDMISGENPAATKAAHGASTDISMSTPRHMDADYFIISENTLFSDTRGRGTSTQAVVTQLPPPLNPKPVLVGTMMIDGEFTASVVDPSAQQTRGGQFVPEIRRVGDVYRGYRITSIEAEQMVLENGGRIEIIPLNRAARRPQAARPQAASGARVVPIGPGGGSSGGVSVSTASASVPVRAAQNAPQNAAQAAAQNSVQNAAVQNAVRQAQQATQQGQRIAVEISPDGEIVFTPENAASPTQTAQPKQPQAKQAQKPQPGVDAQQAPNSGVRQRTVRTPFGEFSRSDSE